MTDGVIGIAECPTPDRLVDNEVLTIGLNEVYRQRVISPTGDAKLDAVIAGLADVLAALGLTLSVTGPLTNAELRAAPVETHETTGLVPEVFDYIDLDYGPDGVTQAVYKAGGAGGAVVKTLTIAYSGGNIDTVTAA